VRWLFFAFLLGHAAVPAVMWTLPFTDATDDMPFNPAESWLFGEQRNLAAVAAGLVTVAYLVAAVGWLAHASWWPPAMVAASTLSLLPMGLFFSPWWLVGIVLSGGLAVWAIQAGS
jgi:hypothetical protein